MNVEAALVLVDANLNQQSLNNLQELIFRQSWQGKSYREIAASFDYDPQYIKDVGFKLWQLLSKAFGEKITKRNFQSVLRRRSHCISPRESHQMQVAHLTEPAIALQHQDWEEAIDVSVFYGRVEELVILEQWVVQERCRLVAAMTKCSNSGTPTLDNA